MLDPVRPWGGVIRAYRSRDVVTRVCDAPWQLAGYWKLRCDVFVREQRLFGVSDRDARDAVAYPIVALASTAGMPDEVVGVVRIYPEAPGIWYGGRLGVTHAYRRHGIVGEKLIKTAVGTARALGCQRFLATVQQANVRYFEHHRFDVLEAIEICGTPHCLMAARVEEFGPLPLPNGALGPLSANPEEAAA